MIVVLSNGLILNLNNVTCIDPQGENCCVYFLAGHLKKQTLGKKLTAELMDKCRALSAVKHAEINNEPHS